MGPQRSEVSESISAKAKGDEATVSWLPLVPLTNKPGPGRETNRRRLDKKKSEEKVDGSMCSAACCRRMLVGRVEHVAISRTERFVQTNGRFSSFTHRQDAQTLTDESFLLFGRASGVERLLEALTLLL